MRKLRAVIFKGKKGFYFHVLGGNNKIICQSEAYKTRQSALKTVRLLKGANDWLIKYELNETKVPNKK